jgi:hypothetical protein
MHILAVGNKGVGIGGVDTYAFTPGSLAVVLDFMTGRGGYQNILKAVVTCSSGKMSPSVPGALEIVTEPASAAKKRITRMVVMFLATQEGMTNRKYKDSEIVYTIRRPYNSDNGARSIGPEARPRR